MKPNHDPDHAGPPVSAAVARSGRSSGAVDALRFVAREIETENGQFSAIMIGPKYYVRRVHERFAAAHGFVVVDVRRDGKCPNPITGETNTVSVISYARRN